jgi:hypothetical protein
MRKTCPRAKLTGLEGNHDNAVLRGLAQALDFDSVGVEWVPEKSQPLQRGNLRLLHGHQVAKMLPKHHAAKVADGWGVLDLRSPLGTLTGRASMSGPDVKRTVGRSRLAQAAH